MMTGLYPYKKKAPSCEGAFLSATILVLIFLLVLLFLGVVLLLVLLGVHGMFLPN